MREEIILYKEKVECCGCAACYAVCPNKAIEMIRDEEGFNYPSINHEKCLCCYQCLSVCPIRMMKTT